MDIGIISSRYARALFGWAKERGVETPVYNDMKMLASSFETEPSIKEILANPVVTAATKTRLLRNAAGIEVSEAFERFVRLVLRHRRETLLPIMSLIYLALYRKEKRIDRLYLYTAVPLDAAIRDRLLYEIRLKTGGSIELSEQIRPELIGGLVMRMNNYRIDASVASQLKRMKRQLIEKTDNLGEKTDKQKERNV